MEKRKVANNQEPKPPKQHQPARANQFSLSRQTEATQPSKTCRLPLPWAAGRAQ